MTYHDHGGCHGRLARPCDAFTGGLAARGTRSLWSIFSHQLPNSGTRRGCRIYGRTIRHRHGSARLLPSCTTLTLGRSLVLPYERRANEDMDEGKSVGRVSQSLDPTYKSPIQKKESLAQEYEAPAEPHHSHARQKPRTPVSPMFATGKRQPQRVPV